MRVALALTALSFACGGFAIGRVTGTRPDAAVSSTDPRTMIAATQGERIAVLEEMRFTLGTIRRILDGLASDDREAAALAAQELSDRRLGNSIPEFVQRLPADYKSAGLTVHREMGELARELRSGADSRQALRRLGAITGKCMTCHESYRLSP